MKGLSFANKVTIVRILSVPFFIATLLYYTPQKDYLRVTALGIFLIAIVTDLIDGYIARTRHQKTMAGSILDPLADKLLLISAFICLYKINGLLGNVKFPLWFVLTVISRDVILLLGSMIIYLVHGNLSIVPTRWGKATTFFQILCILGMLLQIPTSFIVWYLTVALTFISGVGYIKKGIKVLNATAENRP